MRRGEAGRVPGTAAGPRSMSPGVHQVVAGAQPHDAITHHVLQAQRVIRDMGVRSEIFADPRHIHPAVADRLHSAAAWTRLTQPGDLAILHYSIASPAFSWVLERAERSAVHYHNITPAELLWRDAPALALECARGRRALPMLARRVAAAAADSSFNAEELRGLGFPDPVVVGVMREHLVPGVVPPGPRERPRLLFVGRGVPNKAQHDLILALAALHQAGTDAELRLVGAWGGAPAYERRCRDLIRDLRLEDRVAILGSVTDEALAQEYAAADCFVCLSDHEGFCVPVIEAMAAGLPIVAYRAGAVPETVGAAGLLLDAKPPSLVAEAVAETLANPRLRDWMAAGRRRQLERFGAERLARDLRAFVESLL